MDIKFCTACGSPVHLKTPADDDHTRAVCGNCGLVHYSNPKVVVGCIPELDGKILLCRRNIEPGKGRWTLPAGYLENGESVQDGAVRETREETLADVEIIEPYRLFNITFVDQIYVMFRARLLSGQFGPTRESTDVKLYELQNIPWDKIAFQVIRKTLEHYVKDTKNNQGFAFGVFDIKQAKSI